MSHVQYKIDNWKDRVFKELYEFSSTEQIEFDSLIVKHIKNINSENSNDGYYRM